MGFSFNTPMLTSGGTTEQQVAQLRSVLFSMSKTLEYTLNNLDKENFSENGLESVFGALGVGEIQQESSGRYAALKSVILKTADVVEKSIETLETELHSDYVARSEFGTYQEDTDSKITANSNNITQYYDMLTALQTDYEQYITDTEAYIKTGYIYDRTVNGVTVPVYGLAIRQKTTTVTDGVESVAYDNLATFTSNRLSFWLNGAEIGYFSGNSLYVSGGLRLADWYIDPSYGLSIRYFKEE